MNKLTYLLLFLLICVGVLYLFQNPKINLSQKYTQVFPSASPIINASASAHILGIQTKNSDCVVNGVLPDLTCTPGAIITSATKEQICQPGYSKAIRNVPVTEKNAVYFEYGISSRSTGEYEVDHYISLELGGSNDISNLWPEKANPKPGFHEKDHVENYLHSQVCSGAITLEQAQKEISMNWLDVYNVLGK